MTELMVRALHSYESVFFSRSLQSKEVGVQLQEDLMKVLNELYTVSEITDVAITICGSIMMCCGKLKTAFIKVLITFI